MRKILALVLTGAFVFGAVSMASAGEETQSEVFKAKPTKQSKKKPGNISLVNTITTFNKAGTNQPPKGTRTVVDWPKDWVFNTDKVPYCKTDAAGLQNAPTTQEAKAACGPKSQVSSDAGSSAVVRVGNPVGNPTEIDVDVLAFNEKGKTLYLYSKPKGAFSGIAASILVGKLKKFGAVNGVNRPSGPYKQSLDVTIPPLAAGAIAFFEVTIPKSVYIQAKCTKKKWQTQATTVFSDAPTSSDTHVVKCKKK
jgi:hypothetical protein